MIEKQENTIFIYEVSKFIYLLLLFILFFLFTTTVQVSQANSQQHLPQQARGIKIT